MTVTHKWKNEYCLYCSNRKNAGHSLGRTFSYNTKNKGILWKDKLILFMCAKTNPNIMTIWSCLSIILMHVHEAFSSWEHSNMRKMRRDSSILHVEWIAHCKFIHPTLHLITSYHKLSKEWPNLSIMFIHKKDIFILMRMSQYKNRMVVNIFIYNDDYLEWRIRLTRL